MDEIREALDRLTRELAVLEQMLQDHSPDIAKMAQVAHGLETAGDEIASLKHLIDPNHEEIGDDEE